MRPINVVLAHQDPALADDLARSIDKQFLNVAPATSVQEVRSSIARLQAPLAIVDLEFVDFAELGKLCREFPATAIVCTHRLADDAMWSQSLSVGAVDCCRASDLPGILQASDRYVAIKQAHAFSAA